MKYFRVNVPKRYRSEENAKHLMAVATAIKLKKLAKYEKEWLAIKAAERAREDPVVRFERENKKLLSDNLRLDTENDNLARQLVNSKIEMRKEIDRIEDEKDYFEKEASNTNILLREALDEKRRLLGETEQLKAVLKREVGKLESELATRNNVIAEYKAIASQLSAKLEKASAAAHGAQPTDTKVEGDVSEEGKGDRVHELELELAQTKLALVETECKYQDLAHQVSSSVASGGGGRSGTWLSKTLSSIKESASSSSTALMAKGGAMAASAAASATAPSASTSRDPLRKSTSVDTFKS